MSSPSNRRISAYVRVVVLGVLRRVVLWAESRFFRRCPRPSGIWQAPYDPGKRCTLPRQRTLVGCTLCMCVCVNQPGKTAVIATPPSLSFFIGESGRVHRQHCPHVGKSARCVWVAVGVCCPMAVCVCVCVHETSKQVSQSPPCVDTFLWPSCMCVCVCVYERRQTSAHHRVDTFLRPCCVTKGEGGLDVREPSEFSQCQTVSALMCV